MLPLTCVEDFCPEPLGRSFAPGRFTTFSEELLKITARKIVHTFEAEPRFRGRRFDIAFGHNASARVCDLVAHRLGLGNIFFPTHREYGNTVSASIPLGMSLALEQGRLRRGDKVLIIVGSAGITVGLAAFTF